jgi:hypothetical protein
MRGLEAVTEVAGSPDMVWEVLTGFPRYPEWASYIQRIDGCAEKGDEGFAAFNASLKNRVLELAGQG